MLIERFGLKKTGGGLHLTPPADPNSSLTVATLHSLVKRRESLFHKITAIAPTSTGPNYQRAVIAEKKITCLAH